MKGNEIVDLIEDRKLENFDVFVSFTDGYNIFPNIITIPIKGFIKIDKDIHLLGEEGSDSIKGFELAEIISKNEMGDEDISFAFKLNNSKMKIVNIIELGDIGYSDNVVHLQGEDEY